MSPSNLALALLLAAPAVAAQEGLEACGSPALVVVEGTVADASGAAVPGIELTLDCGRATAQVRADHGGRFKTAAPAGTYRVIASHPGFALFSEEFRFAEASPRIAVVLQPAGVSESVTVTAGGFEQSTRRAPASVTIVSREAMAERRLTSLAEALADVEGVDTGQNVGKTGGLSLSMRGMPADYTLMLIDGRRQNPAGNVAPNGFTETVTSFMPPLGAIERIEVVRGPMSTLYGSDAMGGVVNIITRKVALDWGGTASLDGTLQGNRDYGDTAQGSAYLAGPLVADRLGLAVRGSAYRRQEAALRYETVDGTEVPITSFGLSPTKADLRTGGARLSFTPSTSHEFVLDVDGAWQAYDNSKRQLGTLGVQGGYEEELRFERNQFLAAHTARFAWGFVDTSLVRNTTATEGRTIPPGTPGRLAGDPRALRSTNTIAESKLVAVLGPHTLSVGGQWWDAHMVDAVAPLPYDHTQNAVFAEDEWRLSKVVALTLGVRHDDHSTFGGHTSPRAYLVVSPGENWTFKGGVSRGFKTPRLEQLAEGITGFGGQGTIPLLGSPGLKPETSTSTELSVHYARERLGVTAGVFHNQFRDKIASGPGLPNCSFRGSLDRPGCVDYGVWPNVDLFGQSINVDEAETRGAEFAVRAGVGRFDLLANYTYTQSEQQSGAQAGQPLVNTPKHMVNANLRFRASDRLGTWLRVEARSSRTRGTGAAAVAATAALGDYKSYGLVHVGGSYKLSERLTFAATVFNLLDTDFLAYAPYVSAGQTAYASRYNNLQEPRRFWGSLSLNF